jgi:hypothetical protein
METLPSETSLHKGYRRKNRKVKGTKENQSGVSGKDQEGIRIMTKDEQTIANLKKLKSVHNGRYGADIGRAIKAMEQEPILDKIRAEIELEKLGYPPSAGYYKAIMKCLQVIDRYKAEREGKE